MNLPGYFLCFMELLVNAFLQRKICLWLLSFVPSTPMWQILKLLLLAAGRSLVVLKSSLNMHCLNADLVA